MRMVLLGPPGAGKGTQAVMLVEKNSFLHFSTGDILRENVKKGTDIGKEAKSYMDKGDLVPDDTVIKMMVREISAKGKDKDFILDGFPRTIYQAKKIDAEMEKLGLPIDIVIYFETSLDTVLFRLTGRRLCKECGSNYHIKNMPPKKEGICDKCGGELYRRKDDNEETIKKRLEVFNNQTRDLIDYYAQKGILKKISGDLDAGTVYKKISGILNDRDKIKT